MIPLPPGILDGSARVVVAGVSGLYGRNQTRAMREYGTSVVAGVGPGRAGQVIEGLPMFDSFQDAVAATSADVGVTYVNPQRALAAGLDAIDSGLRFVMISAEGVPLHDALILRERAAERGTWLLGPNTIGFIRPGRCLIGTLAPHAATPGPVAVISRSGTLSIETTRVLSAAGLGQSFCVGVGGDRVLGSNPAAWLLAAEQDPECRAIVLIGEVGGHKEYEVAAAMEQTTKPVVAYVVGRHAPQDTVLGHIGAIIRNRSDTAEAKGQALGEAGGHVVKTLWDIPDVVRELL